MALIVVKDFPNLYKILDVCCLGYARVTGYTKWRGSLRVPSIIHRHAIGESAQARAEHQTDNLVIQVELAIIRTSVYS